MRRFLLILVCLAFLPAPARGAEPNVIAVGPGGYAAARPATAKSPQDTIYATEAVAGPIPTNDWWSSLAWMPFSERQYPHPLAVQAEKGGMRVFFPGNRITGTRDAIFGFMPAGSADDLLFGHSNQKEFPEARLDGFSDWFVRARFEAGGNEMLITYGHGSPYIFARFTGGGPQVTFAKPPKVFAGDTAGPAIGVTLNGKHYGLFGPSGSKWEGEGGAVLTCTTSKDYCSLALLPDDSPAAFALFSKYAHAHVSDSRFETRFEEAESVVTSTFTVVTEALEGSERGTLVALYPHQWKHLEGEPLPWTYNSVRGEMKLLACESFETRHRFSGVLPGLPNVAGCDRAEMAKLLRAEAERPLPPIKDTYWDGKWLGATATLIPIAEEYGEAEIAEKLQGRLKARLEAWFTPVNECGGVKPEQLFWYNKPWGTLIGHPASYGSDVELNDHHFHYGYFLRAAGEIARRDPAWATKWAGMVELLARDTASPNRADPLFPFLRNFDPYAGHSWAAGHARFGDGNNNESSSEAMNCWYGLILWGQFTGDRAMRDLGIALYTLEMNAIHEYWFDVHDANHPAEYTPSVVTMIWGGKGANGTWFSGNAEVIHGINWLPIHGGSLYLGHYPEYVEKNYAALREENNGKPWDEWADLVWMYRARSNPEDAMRQFRAGRDSAPKEGGNTTANTYHWIGSLAQLGRVRPGITANTPLHAVFEKETARTYVAYSAAEQGETVTFSDGFRLVIPKAGFFTAERPLK